MMHDVPAEDVPFRWMARTLITLPEGQRLYLQKVDFKKIKPGKSIILEEESKLGGPLQVINGQNYDLLFTKTKIACDWSGS